MKLITLNIPDNKVLFFMELVNNLGFVKNVETDKQGKLKTTSLNDFLNKL